MKPKIPDSTLDELEALAWIPAKSLPPPELRPFWIAVMKLRERTSVEKRIPMNTWAGREESVWQSVRSALDRAMDERDFNLLDVFVKAWTRTKEAAKMDVVRITAEGGNSFDAMYASRSYQPRRPITALIVTCIQVLQNNNNRAPTRAEILDMMGNPRSAFGVSANEGEELEKMPIGNDELLKQIKSMGLWEYFDED